MTTYTPTTLAELREVPEGAYVYSDRDIGPEVVLLDHTPGGPSTIRLGANSTITNLCYTRATFKPIGPEVLDLAERLAHAYFEKTHSPDGWADAMCSDRDLRHDCERAGLLPSADAGDRDNLELDPSEAP